MGQHKAVAETDEVAAALEAVANLLGVSWMSLEGALTHRTITTGGERIRSPLDGDAAGATRDAFAKALYAHAFASLVRSVNEAIVPPPGRPAARRRDASAALRPRVRSPLHVRPRQALRVPTSVTSSIVAPRTCRVDDRRYTR